MLSGKELILATKPYAKEDRSKSWLYTLSTLFILMADMAAVLFAPYLVIRIVCSVILGFLMVRMFIIYHDYEHHAILHKSKLARIIMPLYGAYVLNPASIWKRSHD